MLISVSFRLFDTDVWQHLAFGRAIWTLHSIPRTQVFTWPDYGVPLVNPSWGFSAVLWPFWARAGMTGLFVFRWATTLVLFTLLWRTSRRLGASGFSALFVVFACALVYRQRAQVRPEMLAALWLGISIWLLEGRRQGARDRTLWLIPLALVWANSHISYYLGFLLLGIHGLDALLPPRSAGGRPVSKLVWIGFAMAAVSFLNPYGWQALARPIIFAFTWHKDPLVSQISELKPLDWSINTLNGLPLLVAGWPLLLLWRWRRRGLDRVELMTCIAFTLLGTSGNRFVATYAIGAAPYLARDFDEWMRTRPWPRWSRDPWLRAAVTTLACVAYGWYEWTHFEGPITIDYDRTRVPDRACAFIGAHGIGGRSFNHFYVGGSLVWYFWPDRDRLPFVDIHPEESPPALRAAYYRALTSADGWRALDERYHFDYALMSRRYIQQYGLLDVLDADSTWARVFIDDVATVYVRRQGRLAAVADSFGYRLLTGGLASLPGVLQRAAADSSVRARLVAELERQARGTDQNVRGREIMRSLDVLQNVETLNGRSNPVP